MDQQFAAGDDLIFQLESGYGLLRVLAIEPERQVWHLMAYEDLFPDVETAEQALHTNRVLRLNNLLDAGVAGTHGRLRGVP